MSREQIYIFSILALACHIKTNISQNHRDKKVENPEFRGVLWCFFPNRVNLDGWEILYFGNAWYFNKQFLISEGIKFYNLPSAQNETHPECLPACQRIPCSSRFPAGPGTFLPAANSIPARPCGWPSTTSTAGTSSSRRCWERRILKKKQ